jgi:phage terminase large subunit-like protein
MLIKDELIRYAENCISGEILSGKKHIWACKRFLKDITRKDWEYIWNEEEAEKIVKWFSYLRHCRTAYNFNSLAKILFMSDLCLERQKNREKKI